MLGREGGVLRVRRWVHRGPVCSASVCCSQLLDLSEENVSARLGWSWICKPLILWRIKDPLKERRCSSLCTLLLLLVFTLERITTSVFDKCGFCFLAKTIQ